MRGAPRRIEQRPFSPHRRLSGGVFDGEATIQYAPLDLFRMPRAVNLRVRRPLDREIAGAFWQSRGSGCDPRSKCVWKSQKLN